MRGIIMAFSFLCLILLSGSDRLYVMGTEFPEPESFKVFLELDKAEFTTKDSFDYSAALINRSMETYRILHGFPLMFLSITKENGDPVIVESVLRLIGINHNLKPFESYDRDRPEELNYHFEEEGIYQIQVKAFFDVVLPNGDHREYWIPSNNVSIVVTK